MLVLQYYQWLYYALVTNTAIRFQVLRYHLRVTNVTKWWAYKNESVIDVHIVTVFGTILRNSRHHDYGDVTHGKGQGAWSCYWLQARHHCYASVRGASSSRQLSPQPPDVVRKGTKYHCVAICSQPDKPHKPANESLLPSPTFTSQFLRSAYLQDSKPIVLVTCISRTQRSGSTMC